MNHKPMLFNQEMVRAILEGRKLQTRRIVKNQDCVESDENDTAIWVHDPKAPHPCDYSCTSSPFEQCPYGQAGDLLWVRETFTQTINSQNVVFRSDFRDMRGDFWSSIAEEPRGVNWTPSILMPKWASRITLAIADVSVERIQDITEEEAIAEGFDRRRAFRKTWQQLYGDSWQNNDWVWVIKFEPIFENVLAVIAQRELAA